MNRTRIAFVSLLLAAGAAVLAAQDPPAPPPADYEVHEWGTFTSMVGMNGVALEGLHHEEEALPAFVHDLLKIDEFERGDGKVPASRVTQKMETPVIYFHSREPLHVQVSVWFQQGLMTQFYPLPDSVSPMLQEARKQRVDMSKVDGSSLAWDIDLIPHGAPPPELPQVDAGQPWAFARQVDAAYVRTRCSNSPARPETEQYLFYRGLGRWQPPVKLQAEAGGKASFANGMAAPIPFVAVLELGARGGRFVIGRPMAGGARQQFDLGSVALQADRERVARELGAHVLQALTAQGLFVDEARAMVATWSRSWFHKDGARVIYLLPRQQTDQVLPLYLEPKPKALVRVLVGRLEFITPETQARVEQALRDRAAEDQGLRAAAAATLAELDRFLEPHLRNVAAHGADAAVRAAAAAMLASPAR